MSKDAEAAFDRWMEHAIRYFVLANSGAAIATLSFMGASGRVPFMGVLALLSFVAGVIAGGLVIFGQLTFAWRRSLNPDGTLDPEGIDHAVAARWTTRLSDNIEKKSGTYLWFAFGLFVLGNALGLAALLFASCTLPTS